MWIKTQDGVLLDARELYLTSAGGGGGSNKTEIHSDEIKCGSYKDHETAKTVLGMIEDFIVGGYETLFVMPDKDVTVFPMHDVSRPINLPLCGYYPRCEMIDVEAAAESIRRTEAAMKFVRDHRRQAAEMVTTFPIDDEIRCFEFKSHNRKKVHSVSFDEHTDLVTVVFYDPGPESG